MNFTTASSTSRTKFADNYLLKIEIGIILVVWIYTFIGTTDRTNWWIENILTILSLSVLTYTYRKFKFSDLSYSQIFVFILLHIYGSMYTYAENPFGYWLQDLMQTSRNHYDRMVHFSFGLLASYPLRDYFINKHKWVAWVCWVLPVIIIHTLSGFYEMIEWAVADIFFPAQGIAYLGTQGDIWDAQKDMTMAFAGSAMSMLLFYGMKKFKS
jgi:putative membrane protein